MKTTLALIVVLTAGACSKTQPVTTVIHVEGMTCGSCEQAIQAEVKRLEGVQSVRASHKEKKVWGHLPSRPARSEAGGADHQPARVPGLHARFDDEVSHA